MKIGISFSQAHDKQGIWENGAGQNTYFLLELLKQSPDVEQVYLVNYSGFEGFSPNMGLAGLEPNLVRFDDVKDQLDVMIEVGIQLNKEQVTYLRGRGCVFIGYRMGNEYIIDVERMLFGRVQGLYFDGVPYDEIWTNPQHVNTCKSYWELCYNAPVHVLPHIWSPYFLEQIIALLKAENNLDFGYQHNKYKGDVAVFEPNINLVKTSIIPTLVVEAAYRKSPDTISHLYVTNGMQLAQTKAWAHMVNALQIFKDGKITTEPRYLTPFFMAKYASVIVTHQWENALNYLYYDALYGNYPLIHNSPMIKDYGYYYPDFDAGLGADQLIRAIKHHSKNLPAYASKSQELLKSVSTHLAANLDQHMQRIHTLLSKRSRV